jgi:hypothetical protein
MKYLALHLCFFFCISTTYIACTSSVNTTNSKTADTKYQHLSKNKSIKGFVDKAVCIEGTESIEINQHMMKPYFSLEGEVEEKHLYVDYNNGQQIVVYYKNINLPEDQKKHKFYGTVREMSGAGKGGKMHTEYYLDLDKVE